MAITILAPSDSDDELDGPFPSSASSSQLDSSSDNDADYTSARQTSTSRPNKRPRLSSSNKRILVPGETITTEPQWMRGHGTFIPSHSSPSSSTTTPNTNPTTNTTMTATLPGPLQRTNKLLSISPLRARYTPSIGDLVIGRIVLVDKSRWRVDIAAPLLAHLPLSSINLPGGVLRRRTTADELQMRTYFQEGDLVIAEVQGVGNQDGVAGLHTRSLRYGKLRDGIFVAVGGAGGKGVGVVRGKRQVFTVHAANGGGEVDVALGVNGFVWVSGHVDPQEETATAIMEQKQKEKKGRAGVSISNLDEMVSHEIYSSQNHDVGVRTMREIARLCASITLLAEAGCRVDEESVHKAYHAAVEVEMETMLVDEGGDEDHMGGGGGGGGGPELKVLLTKRIVQAVVGGG